MKKTLIKLFAADQLFWLSRWLAVFVCVVCALVTFKLWGIIATIVGLLLGGVGVVPMAILASALGGHWAGFSLLISLVSFVTLLRWLGLKATESALFDTFNKHPSP